MDQTNVSVVDPATPPGSPSGPNPVKNVVIGLLVGLVLGFGLAILLEILDRRVRSMEDVSGSLGLPLLGTLEKA